MISDVYCRFTYDIEKAITFRNTFSLIDYQCNISDKESGSFFDNILINDEIIKQMVLIK